MCVVDVPLCFLSVRLQKIRNDLRAAPSSKVSSGRIFVLLFYLFSCRLIMFFVFFAGCCFSFKEVITCLLLLAGNSQVNLFKKCQKKVIFIKCNVQRFQHYCSKVQATCCAMTKWFLGGFRCKDPFYWLTFWISRVLTDDPLPRIYLPFYQWLWCGSCCK